MKHALLREILVLGGCTAILVALVIVVVATSAAAMVI
jgi:hypothetical protein